MVARVERRRRTSEPRRALGWVPELARTERDFVGGAHVLGEQRTRRARRSVVARAGEEAGDERRGRGGERIAVVHAPAVGLGALRGDDEHGADRDGERNAARGTQPTAGGRELGSEPERNDDRAGRAGEVRPEEAPSHEERGFGGEEVVMPHALPQVDRTWKHAALDPELGGRVLREEREREEEDQQEGPTVGPRRRGGRRRRREGEERDRHDEDRTNRRDVGEEAAGEIERAAHPGRLSGRDGDP